MEIVYPVATALDALYRVWLGFTWFLLVFTGFYWVLLGFTGFCLVLMSIRCMVVAFRRFIERLARFPPAAPCFYSSDRQSANHGAAVLVWILIFPLRCFFNSSALLSFVLGFQRKKNVFALTHMFYRQPPSTSSVIRPFFFCFSFYFFSLPSSPPSFSSLWFFERSW